MILMAILANFSHAYGSHCNIPYIFGVWPAYLTSLVPLFSKDIFASSVYFLVNLSLLIKYVYYACYYFYVWSSFCFIIKSCQTLCDPIDCSPSVSSVHGISQARILEWVAISFSGNLPDPGIEPTSPELAGAFFTTEPPGKPKATT